MKQSRIMITEDEDTRIALNNLARHKTIYNLYRDILIDMTVCEIEGWDKLEYLNLLKGVIKHFERKVKQRSDKEHTNEVLEKIKDDIGRYELDCRFADYSQTDECTICNKNVFESIYRIIDKYIEGSDSE